MSRAALPVWAVVVALGLTALLFGALSLSPRTVPSARPGVVIVCDDGPPAYGSIDGGPVEVIGCGS